MEKTIQSEAETEAFAKRVAGLLRPPMIIGLTGSLGVGKTTFVRYLAKAWGIVEPVSSPSYVLQHIYRSPAGIVIEHWDLYRLTTLPQELEEPSPENTIRLIEWADKVAGFSENVDVLIDFSLPSSKEPEKRLVRVGGKVRLQV